MARPTIYFAHPISTYVSAREDRAIALLDAAGFQVVNPSDRVHQDVCGNDMTKWAALAGTCDALAALPFEDGAFGAGVGQEAQSVHAQGKPVHTINWDATVLTPERSWPGERTILSVEDTRARLRSFRDTRKAAGLAGVPVREPAGTAAHGVIDVDGARAATAYVAHQTTAVLLDRWRAAFGGMGAAPERSGAHPGTEDREWRTAPLLAVGERSWSWFEQHILRIVTSHNPQTCVLSGLWNPNWPSALTEALAQAVGHDMEGDHRLPFERRVHAIALRTEHWAGAVDVTAHMPTFMALLIHHDALATTWRQCPKEWVAKTLAEQAVQRARADIIHRLNTYTSGFSEWSQSPVTLTQAATALADALRHELRKDPDLHPAAEISETGAPRIAPRM